MSQIIEYIKDKKLTNETVSTINLFTGSDIKLKEDGEVTDVCLAIEEMKKEAAEEAGEPTEGSESGEGSVVAETETEEESKEAADGGNDEQGGADV